MTVPRRGVAVAAVVMVALAALPIRNAWAYDPASTHAGLTERAVLASALHKVLARRLLRTSGLFERLTLHGDRLPVELARRLSGRLATLDPADGARPDADAGQTALSWIVAGSVIAQAPPEQGRNHFFDPTVGRGLDDPGVLAGFFHQLHLAVDGGADLRGVATGTGFDLTGMSSIDWWRAPSNDLSLRVFYDSLADAALGADPAARETSLSLALLALGGVLSVLEDAGEPAHVRNDFQGAFLASNPGGGAAESPFERWVANAYGRGGVPAPKAPVRRPDVRSFVTAADGLGLADRTNRGFFSSGTVPHDGVIDRDTTPHDLRAAASRSLTYALPAMGPLDLREPGRVRYLVDDGHRVLAYRRVPGRVRYFLDDRTYADAANTLLPEIGAYAAGLVDHLFRGELGLSIADGTLEVRLGTAGMHGALRIVGEDANGQRRELASLGVPATAATGSVIATVAVPAGLRRVAAVLRGEDAAGELVALGEAKVP